MLLFNPEHTLTIVVAKVTMNVIMFRLQFIVNPSTIQLERRLYEDIPIIEKHDQVDLPSENTTLSSAPVYYWKAQPLRYDVISWSFPILLSVEQYDQIPWVMQTYNA